MSALKSLKRAVLATVRAAGGFRVVRHSRWRQQRLLILCYHGVSIADEHEWNPELYISQDRFRERMAMLRDGGYPVLPLTEAISRLQSSTLPKAAVAITFDDGAHDFAVRALPVLREFGLPATVYLTTYYCTHQMPVFDTACSYLLWKAIGGTYDFADLLPGGGTRSINNRTDARTIAAEFRSVANSSDDSAVVKDQRLRLLAKRLRIDDTPLREQRLLHLMTPGEVASLATGQIDVQLHTYRHRTPRDREAFLYEIAANREDISRFLPGQSEPSHFCYPSGDHAPEFLPWLNEAGVTSATTCEPGLAGPHANTMLLPRLIDTMHMSNAEVQAWLDGVAQWLPRRPE